MSPHRLEIAARTVCGPVRRNNEDALQCLPDAGVVVLADGMGGHRAGEIASELAVREIGNALAERLRSRSAEASCEWLRQAVALANREIFAQAERSADCRGMGTTVVAGLFLDNRLFHAHVGDSRLYRLRDGDLTALTRDHSLLQSLVEQGLFKTRREARAAGVSGGQLTRALGLSARVEVDEAERTLAPGDLYLFCSDGLTDRMTDRMIHGLLLQSLPDLSRAADRLLEAALEQGGTDNISLVLARPGAPVPA